MEGRKGTSIEPFWWVEEYSNSEWQQQSNQSSSRKKKQIEFAGWGSKPLIRFLDSIGRPTSQPLSQFEVNAIVTEYVNKSHPQKENQPSYDLYGRYSSIKTQPPAKKRKKMKRVVCDERLYSLFGKKSIARNMIFTLLERHLAEANSEIDSNASLSCDGGDKKTEAVISGRLLVPEIPNPGSRFAAMIPENLKLVYLRRSLVEEILKKDADSETKIVGSFVRIRSNPNDCLRKYSHCLVQIMGLKRDSEGDDTDAKILLHASGLIKDILVSDLSDVDFCQEECDEFYQKIKDGYIEKLTVAELQRKANILHMDMINHWLPRELTLLQMLIDRANEKGWRRDLPDYLDRMELLQRKDEQERLLSEVPKIISETIEPEVKPLEVTEEVNQGDDDNNNPSRSIDDNRVSVAPLSDDGEDDFHLTWAGYCSKELQPEEYLQEGMKGLEKSPIASLDIDDDMQSVNVVENKKEPENPPRSSLDIDDERQSVDVVENKNKEPKKSPSMSLGIDDDMQSVNVVENKSKELEKSSNASIDIDNEAQSVDIVENKSPEIEKCPNESADIDDDTQIENVAENKSLKIEKSSSESLDINDERQSVNVIENKSPRIKIASAETQTIYLSDEDKACSPTAKTEPHIICLSDDDDDVEAKKPLKVETFDDKAVMWHYLDPQKVVQGPFSLEMLKRWNNVGYFPADFSIWKIGQSPDEALSLKLILGKQVYS